MSFVENQGVKIYYEVHGQGDHIVFLHGFTSSSRAWKSTGYLSKLEKSYRVIAIDQRGHGQSDKPHDREAYHLERRMADVITPFLRPLSYRMIWWRCLLQCSAGNLLNNGYLR